jgi:hypothetical protein
MDEKSVKKTRNSAKLLKEASAGRRASSLLREKTKAGLKHREEVEIKDPFTEAGFSAGGPAALKDKLSHDASILKSEWSLFGGELAPETWLEQNKGYTQRQSKMLIDFEGLGSWLEERTKVQNAILEKMAKRNIDQIVESNEYFVKGAKLGLVKTMDSLAKNPIRTINALTGRWESGLSMKDLSDGANALEKYHAVYLKAMGVHPKENVGITQIVNQLKVVHHHATGPSTGTTVEATSTTVEGVPDPRLESLTYDEMFQVIEKIRESGLVKDPEPEE